MVCPCLASVFLDRTLLVLFVLLFGHVADLFPAAPLASWVTCLSCFGSGFVLVVVGATPSPSSVVMSAVLCRSEWVIDRHRLLASVRHAS